MSDFAGRSISVAKALGSPRKEGKDLKAPLSRTATASGQVGCALL